MSFCEVGVCLWWLLHVQAQRFGMRCNMKIMQKNQTNKIELSAIGRT